MGPGPDGGVWVASGVCRLWFFWLFCHRFSCRFGLDGLRVMGDGVRVVGGRVAPAVICGGCDGLAAAVHYGVASTLPSSPLFAGLHASSENVVCGGGGSDDPEVIAAFFSCEYVIQCIRVCLVSRGAGR